MSRKASFQSFSRPSASNRQNPRAASLRIASSTMSRSAKVSRVRRPAIELSQTARLAKPVVAITEPIISASAMVGASGASEAASSASAATDATELIEAKPVAMIQYRRPLPSLIRTLRSPP